MTEPTPDHDHTDTDEHDEELERHFEEVSQQLGLLFANVSLPGFLDADDPLFGIFLDQPEQSDRREELLRHVWQEYFGPAARVAMIEAIDGFLATNPAADASSAARMIRDALLEPYSYVDTDWVQFQVSTERFFDGLQAYLDFWRGSEASEELAALACDLEQADQARAEAIEGLTGAGRDGVRATLQYLEREYVELLSDYEALQEKGTEPLLAAIEVLRGVPGLGAATVLCDQLAIINHPEVERVLFDALLEMPEPAARVAADFISFEPLQPATRFVLHELLHKLEAAQAAGLMGAEFARDPAAEDRFGDEDLVDLAEMWCECAGPRMSLVAVRLAEDASVPDEAREQFRAFLDKSEEAELIAWARGRASEELPVVFFDESELQIWSDRLAERWGCEPTDSKVAEVFAHTPAGPLQFYSPAEADPEPGPKEQFLEKICRHEVAEQAKQFMAQAEEQIPIEEVQAWLSQNWWIQPRAESAWKPPLLSMLKERLEALPASEKLRETQLQPMLHSHLATAVRLTEQGAEPQLIDLHLLIAQEMLPEDDPLMGYARKLRAAAAKQTQSPKLWTPDQGGGAPTTKVGRNDPCPCGSGKKYKKCCLGR